MASSASQENEVSQPVDTTEDQSTSTEVVASEAVSDEVATRFIGQWNQLVSTTNWEKGSIICEWREALIETGAAVTDYSDEAWAQLVGNVTSQHVGRLRRVNQRFGGDSSQYQGLYWSHLQAALDWDDAEMWLEGAIQNEWSVSQMRGQRWETLETSPEDQRSEVAAEIAEMDEEVSAEESSGSEAAEKGESASRGEDSAAVTSSTASIKAAENEKDATTSETREEEKGSDGPTEQATQVSKRTRLNVDVESLPDDLAEAFEGFKLAIIAHRLEGWTSTTPEVVVECLEGLRELALADEDK